MPQTIKRRSRQLCRSLFLTRTSDPRNGTNVARDGLFLIPTQLEGAGNAPLTVVINWTAGLKK